MTATARSSARTAANIPPANKFRVSTAGMSRDMTFIQGAASSIPQEPTVAYTAAVSAQIDYLVEKSALEVGWFGLVRYLEDSHTYLIHRIVIPPQTVSATETDITSENWAKVVNDLLNEGVDTSEMYAWFHSHVNMGVSPSGQDERQVEEYVEHAPVFIRGIVNKKGASKVDVYYRDFGIAYTCVPEEIHDERRPNWIAGIDETLKANVKKQVFTAAFYAGRYPVPKNPQDPHGFRQASRSPEGTAYDIIHRTTYGFDDDSDETDDPFFQGTRHPDTVGLPATTLGEDDDTLDAQDDFILAGLVEFDPFRGSSNYRNGNDSYGYSWDETVPLTERPHGWSLDPQYLAYGYAFDCYVD